MKVAVAGFHHESNTFNPIITGADDFVVLRRGEVFSKMTHYGSINGVISTLQSFGYEVVPTLFARAVPNGVVSRDFYLSIKAELLEMMRGLQGIDALMLALHGSMRVEEIGDAEGDMLEALREIFPTIPTVAALDMHATLTDKMMANANAFVGYKCAPHTDTYETGAHAAEMTRLTLEKGVRLTMAAVRVPMLIAGEKSETSTHPMTGRIARLRELERDDDERICNRLQRRPPARFQLLQAAFDVAPFRCRLDDFLLYAEFLIGTGFQNLLTFQAREFFTQ